MTPITSSASWWHRRTQLETYPDGKQRYTCLAIVVLVTIVLYYQFYLAGAVAAGTDGRNGILVDYHMSFVYYVDIVVAASVLGAIASFMTGMADRHGRVNIVTLGLVAVSLLCLVGVPLATNSLGFAVVFAAIGFVEGMILVATPALIRDFSPQVGRASAMGFWTIGPVAGSLAVSIQTSSTSVLVPWHEQYMIAGAIGLIVAAVSASLLRELSPALRDQVMVSIRERMLIEARAGGADVAAALRHPLRQVLTPRIVLAALSISAFLIIYYIAVGFFPVYFQTVFGYSQARANSLGNWMWSFNAATLVLIGYLSDKVRVRKPFMVVGALGAIAVTVIFASRAGRPDTSYATFVVTLSLLAVFLGAAYAPWMASFTETVEARSPALVLTGLSVWGLIIRLTIAAAIFIAPFMVTTVSTLVEQGPEARMLATRYAPELATAAKLTPATAQALARNPSDRAAAIAALSEVAGVSVPDVTQIIAIDAGHPSALRAARAIDRQTLARLVSGKASAGVRQRAAVEVAKRLHVSAAEAQGWLAALAVIPPAYLNLLQRDGVRMARARTALLALAEVPAADFAVLKAAQRAARDSPGQWRAYFGVALGGEVAFIPLIFLLAGFWSPRAARLNAEAHQSRLAGEVAKLDVQQGQRGVRT